MLVELEPFGRLALDAAMLGAKKVAEVSKGEFTIQAKSSHRDLVTDADAAAERTILDRIREERPEDAVLAEESGRRDGTTNIRWIIDPLDGTANFAHGRSDYAVAVAAEIETVVRAGAIVKPVSGEWIASDETGKITASSGLVSVSQPRSLKDALISLSVSISPERRPLTLSTLVRLLPEVQDFRRTGSTSCDLFSVAAGELDAYVGIGTKPWDIAAGWAVVTAAGGTCVRFPVAGGHEAFILGAPAIVDELASIVTSHAQLFTATRSAHQVVNVVNAAHASSRPASLGATSSQTPPRDLGRHR